MLNIPAEDVPLRREFTVLLDPAGVQPSSLPTIDLIPENLRSGLQWFLVDHNGPRDDIVNKDRTNILGLIDHHADEEGNLTTSKDWPRVMQEVGSCGSLIVAHTNYDRSFWNPGLAQVALGPILIDTNNLKSSKTTDVDRKAVSFLADIFESSQTGQTPSTSPDQIILAMRQGEFDTLSTAKADIDRLSVEEVLRKDYKEWTVSSPPAAGAGAAKNVPPPAGIKYGISSVVKGLPWLEAKSQTERGSELAPLASRYGKLRQGLELFVINAASTDGRGKALRELHVFDFSGRFAARLVGDARAELGLVGEPELLPLEQGPGCHFRARIGKNMSRKLTAPLVRKSIEAVLQGTPG